MFRNETHTWKELNLKFLSQSTFSKASLFSGIGIKIDYGALLTLCLFRLWHFNCSSEVCFHNSRVLKSCLPEAVLRLFS